MLPFAEIIPSAVAPMAHDWSHLINFGFRLGVDAIALIVLVRVLYYPRHHNKDFVFSFTLFNVINFLICHLLSNNNLQVGFAFGLFAIFSILRYRTVAVPIREMAYLVSAVTLGLINALTELPAGWTELIIANVGLLGLTALLDRDGTLPHENTMFILYDRPELLLPDRQNELLEDLRLRTGLTIHRVQVDRIDLVRDMARIRVFHFSVSTPAIAESSGGDGD
ncbi:MAG: DUF4956 domain-containing protein [Gemmataceae bacterium]